MPTDFKVLITADEAWPALERVALTAQHRFIGGFRIFDMRTKLRSAEARAIGDDWFDLLLHLSRKGVRIELSVSDFDPVMATHLHELSWTTVRQGAALSAAAGPQAAKIRVKAHMHPAQAGFLPWLGFLPAVLRKKRESMKSLGPARRKYGAVGLDRRWVPRLHTVSHHQKVAVIDDDWLYVGGLDLNERRYDTPEHTRPARKSWSDVQVLMRGPEARAALDHLETLAEVTAGRRKPPKTPGLKRTLSAPRRLQLPFLSPRTLVNEIEDAHLKAFRTARHLIYIETQFIRSSRIAEALSEAGQRNTGLSAVFVLPGLPEDVAFDSSESLDARYGLALKQQSVRTLQQAFGDRLTLATPVRPVLAARSTQETLAGSPLIHVHNKVLIRDDDLVLIGSANLNGRSMRWDTELAVEITQPERVFHARERLMAHWWHAPLPDEARVPKSLQNWWHKEIARNGVSRPENRTGLLVPHDADRGADMAVALPGVTEDIV